MGFVKNKCGFTFTELLVVTAILSSIPVSSYVGAKQKALQIECASQLRQIGMAVNMFTMTEGKYPDAVFYPEKPLNDPRSIAVILKPYGMRGKILICPTAPSPLKERGLTYLWNDKLSGKAASQVKNTTTTWMMTDITALDERVSSHQGGYNILYADGHVAWSPTPPPLKAEK
jgi:prepilin-type processing-associated H-X9-DG protein/prepilin-type N-terminal cleavage/methylation domain-containing protein